MKRLYTHFLGHAASLILLCVFAQGAVAQSFTITGTVLDVNNNPVANQSIYIQSDSNNSFFWYSNTVTTNASGNYSDVIPNGAQSGPNIDFLVSTSACNQFFQQTLANNQGSTTSGVANFTVCASSSTCTSDFSTSAQGTGLTIQFTEQASPATGLTYSWTFGDGGTSTAQNPSHTYNSSGTYQVCLDIDDGNGCTDQHCIMLTVAPLSYTIAGSVTAGNFNLVESARVYLIEHDQAAGTLTALDSTDIDQQDSGYYVFPGLNPGDYLIKAALRTADPNYASYIPTYASSNQFWSGATTYTVSPNQWNASVNLINATNPGGPGFIGGLISQGANKTAGPGDPRPNELVLLLDMNDEPVAYTYSGTNGSYSFENIPYGTYQVYTEVLGLPTEAPIVTINENRQQEGIVDIQIGENEVSSNYMPTGRDELQEAISLSVYPNPIRESMNVEINSDQEMTLELVIRNTLGQPVMMKQRQASAGQSNWIVNTESLPAGIYTISINDQQNAIGLVKTIIKD